MKIQLQQAGPVGWLLKILVLVSKVAYWVIRFVAWLLKRILPGK